MMDTIRNRGTTQAYATNVTGAVLPCGHWVAEEIPEILLEHLLPFLA
jgi:haloacetate dehalogenase